MLGQVQWSFNVIWTRCLQETNSFYVLFSLYSSVEDGV